MPADNMRFGAIQEKLKEEIIKNINNIIAILVPLPACAKPPPRYRQCGESDVERVPYREENTTRIFHFFVKKTLKYKTRFVSLRL